MNHQINHLLRKKYILVRRYKYNHQISDKNILSAITANRAFDKYPMPSKRYKDKVRSITANRAFRGMAGLAVLYPSVLDYIGQAVKDALSVLYGALRGYSVNLCR